MKLNEKKFLKTELGKNLIECVTTWDKELVTIGKCSSALPQFHEKFRRALKTASWCQAQFEVYKLMFKQFYGVDCRFIRTDDYFGIAYDIWGTDFLFKVERSDR